MKPTCGTANICQHLPTLSIPSGSFRPCLGERPIHRVAVIEGLHGPRRSKYGCNMLQSLMVLDHPGSLVTWGPNPAWNKHILEHIDNLHGSSSFNILHIPSTSFNILHIPSSSFFVFLHHGSGSFSTLCAQLCAPCATCASYTPSRASASPWTKNSSRTCHAQIRLIPGHEVVEMCDRCHTAATGGTNAASGIKMLVNLLHPSCGMASWNSKCLRCEGSGSPPSDVAASASLLGLNTKMNRPVILSQVSAKSMWLCIVACAFIYL